MLRLERNRWKGVEEPRILLRALCESLRGEVRALGEDGSFWARLAAAAGRRRAWPARPGSVVDRRGDGFAGVVGELITSGEPVLVGVADVARRRESLETLVAGLADDGLAVVSWDALAADPGLADGFPHLVALDPPPGGAPTPCSRSPLTPTSPGARPTWTSRSRSGATGSSCARS